MLIRNRQIHMFHMFKSRAPILISSYFISDILYLFSDKCGKTYFLKFYK